MGTGFPSIRKRYASGTMPAVLAASITVIPGGTSVVFPDTVILHTIGDRCGLYVYVLSVPSKYIDCDGGAVHMITLDDFADDFPDRILVLDTETTGLSGGPEFRGDTKHDAVVDIGICEACLSSGTVRDVYSSIVGYETDSWPDEMLHSWIFEHTDLTPEKVACAVPFFEVKKQVEKIVRGRWLTTYNVRYDLDKFLYREPWFFKGLFMECRDIMFSAADVCALPLPDPRLETKFEKYRYPKLDYAYAKILGGQDPAGIHGVQDHRALSDARVASYVMLKMYADGKYDPMDLRGRHS